MKASVYLASRVGNNPIYVENARTLGRLLAENGIEVIYGGSRVGCMGALFEGVREAGGKITGVFPQGFAGRKEDAKKGITIMQDGDGYANYTLVSPPNLDERIRIMEKLADACIVLPGSQGTMHEFFSFFEGKVLGNFDKPILILNTNGYYDPLIQLFQKMQDAGFHYPGALQSLIIKDNPTDLVAALCELKLAE